MLPLAVEFLVDCTKHAGTADEFPRYMHKLCEIHIVCIIFYDVADREECVGHLSTLSL